MPNLMPDSRATSLISYKDSSGNDVFRLARDGTIFVKAIQMRDGSYTATAGGISPTPSLVDGGAF